MSPIDSQSPVDHARRRADIAIGRRQAGLALHVNLARLARGQLLAVRTERLHDAAGSHAPDRTAMLEPLAARQRRRSKPFGAAVQLPDHFWSEPVDPFFLEPCGAGRSEMPDGAKRRDVIPGAHVFGQAPDAAHHGRNEIEPARAIAFGLAQRRFGIEFRHQHELCADLKPAERGDERTVVIHRPGHQNDVVALDAPEGWR